MNVRPTLEQVAARAGVSAATASRVLNGATVKPASRIAVERAIAELGYVPNQHARSLATQRANSIALVIGETSRRVFSGEPFFAELIHSVTLELDEADTSLVLMIADSAKGYGRVEQYAGARHVDGVIIAAVHGNDPLPTLLARRGIPVVLSGRPYGNSDLPYVDVDHVEGAVKAVRHLIEIGRTRIATIAGPPDMVAGIDRLSGYRQVMADSGLRTRIAFGGFTHDSGQQAMNEILGFDPDVDAVFAASDLMALGAMRALHAAGRRVPDDVAVIGFDDSQQAAMAQPSLSTVNQPFPLMGREMARMVLRLAAGEGPVEPVLFPTELVVRDSTG